MSKKPQRILLCLIPLIFSGQYLPPRVVHCVSCDLVVENDIPVTTIVSLNGVLWFASHGLFRYDGTHWSHYPVKEILFDDYITALAVGSDRDIWIGTSSGVAHFDGKVWTVYAEESPFRRARSIRAITIAKDKSVWFATSGVGLVRFDGKQWNYFPDDPERSLTCSDIVAAPQGDVWASLMFDGLSLIRGEQIKRISLNEPSGGLKMQLAPDGSLWAITRTDGVLIHIVNGVEADVRGQPINYAGSIAVDGKGKVWIGGAIGEKGLAVLKGKTWTLYDQLPFNVVWDIAFGKDETVWLATERGVYRFVPPK